MCGNSGTSSKQLHVVQQLQTVLINSPRQTVHCLIYFHVSRSWTKYAILKHFYASRYGYQVRAADNTGSTYRISPKGRRRVHTPCCHLWGKCTTSTTRMVFQVPNSCSKGMLSEHMLLRTHAATPTGIILKGKDCLIGRQRRHMLLR